MERQSTKWNNMFEEYKAFVEINLCFPSTTTTEVGKWLSTQRNNLKRGNLHINKKLRLDSINKAWCLSTEERRNAEHLMAISSPWKSNIAEDAVPIDVVIHDNAVLAGLIRKGVYDLKSLLDKTYFIDNVDSEIRELVLDYDLAYFMTYILTNLTSGQIKLMRDICGFKTVDHAIEFYNSFDFKSKEDAHNEIYKLLDQLEEYEREVVCVHYGIDSDGNEIKGCSLNKVANDLDTSKERIRSTIAKALRKLRSNNM